MTAGATPSGQCNDHKVKRLKTSFKKEIVQLIQGYIQYIVYILCCVINRKNIIMLYSVFG